MIDGNGLDFPSTKLAASAIKEFDIKRSFTLVYSDEDEVLLLPDEEEQGNVASS